MSDIDKEVSDLLARQPTQLQPSPAAYWLLGANEGAAFWIAYVMTRPLGASFADWTGRSAAGGLEVGGARVALVLTVLIVALVGYLTLTKGSVDVPLPVEVNPAVEDLATERG